jgi:hypothetical protein
VQQGSIVEGYLYKKNKKDGILKKTWHKLFGKELYSFKHKGDSKHKEIKSL